MKVNISISQPTYKLILANSNLKFCSKILVSLKSMGILTIDLNGGQVFPCDLWLRIMNLLKQRTHLFYLLFAG